jgi:hypothetical protein
MDNYNLGETLIRVEERLIALDDKVEKQIVQTEKAHTRLSFDVDSLKESRSKFRGILIAISGIAGWLGIDKLLH